MSRTSVTPQFLAIRLFPLYFALPPHPFPVFGSREISQTLIKPAAGGRCVVWHQTSVLELRKASLWSGVPRQTHSLYDVAARSFDVPPDHAGGTIRVLGLDAVEQFAMFVQHVRLPA